MNMCLSMVQNEASTGRNSQLSGYSEHLQETSESSAELMDSEDVAVSSQSIGSTQLSMHDLSDTVTLDEAGQRECNSCLPTLCTDFSLNVSAVEKNVSLELLSTDEEISGEVCDASHVHKKPLPARRSVAIQTDAYDSDDEESSDEETSTSDVDSDSSTDGSVHSNLSSPVIANHSNDDIDHCSEENVKNAMIQPVADDSNSCHTSRLASFDRETDGTLSNSSSDNSSSTTYANTCTNDTNTKRMPSPVGLLLSEQNCSNGSGFEAAVVKTDPPYVIEDAGQYHIASPGESSKLHDGDDCSSITNTVLHSSVAVSVSDTSLPEQTTMSDADQVPLFKVPGCSPEDIGRFYSDIYQSSSGAYSSPQSNYGSVSSECVQSQNSLRGITCYSMPTPSPTNSSSRSFNMASPSSYQQLEQSGTVCYQMELNSYQSPTSLPTSVASCQRPLVENYSQPLAPYHQTMTPPMERANSCSSAPETAYMGESVQHHPGYHLVGRGLSSVPQVTGSWSTLCGQQQQSAVKPLEFVPLHANHGHVMPHNVSQTSYRSSSAMNCRSNIDSDRRYSGKNCNKSTTSHSAMRTAQNAVPRVSVHSRTNVITDYDNYSSSVAECTRSPCGDQMYPGLDYHSLHHQTVLGYPHSFVSHPPNVGVPSNIYQYQQQAAGRYAATAQLNHMHGQTMSSSTVVYDYMNRTVAPFDMNAMRH